MSKKKTQTSGKLEKKESIYMKTRRYELTGKEWKLLRPLIPISHTGRPQKNIARISTALCGSPAAGALECLSGKIRSASDGAPLLRPLPGRWDTEEDFRDLHSLEHWCGAEHGFNVD